MLIVRSLVQIQFLISTIAALAQLVRSKLSKLGRWFETSKRRKHRGIEQLVARLAHNQKVTGSSPVSATTHGNSAVG